MCPLGRSSSRPPPRHLMPSANASLLTCGHHTSPVRASVHSASLTWFQRFRSPARTGAAACSSPVSRYRSRSVFEGADGPVTGVPAGPRTAAAGTPPGPATGPARSRTPARSSRQGSRTWPPSSPRCPPQKPARPVTGRLVGSVPAPGRSAPAPAEVSSKPAAALPCSARLPSRRPPGVAAAALTRADEAVLPSCCRKVVLMTPSCRAARSSSRIFSCPITPPPRPSRHHPVPGPRQVRRAPPAARCPAERSRRRQRPVPGRARGHAGRRRTR